MSPAKVVEVDAAAWVGTHADAMLADIASAFKVPVTWNEQTPASPLPIQVHPLWCVWLPALLVVLCV